MGSLPNSLVAVNVPDNQQYIVALARPCASQRVGLQICSRSTTLLDLTVRGARVKAIAQMHKQGFTFVFDRVNGRPLWPWRSARFPSPDIPGEDVADAAFSNHHSRRSNIRA